MTPAGLLYNVLLFFVGSRAATQTNPGLLKFDDGRCEFPSTRSIDLYMQHCGFDIKQFPFICDPENTLTFGSKQTIAEAIPKSTKAGCICVPNANTYCPAEKNQMTIAVALLKTLPIFTRDLKIEWPFLSAGRQNECLWRSFASAATISYRSAERIADKIRNAWTDLPACDIDVIVLGVEHYVHYTNRSSHGFARKPVEKHSRIFLSTSNRLTKASTRRIRNHASVVNEIRAQNLTMKIAAFISAVRPAYSPNAFFRTDYILWGMPAWAFCTGVLCLSAALLLAALGHMAARSKSKVNKRKRPNPMVQMSKSGGWQAGFAGGVWDKM